MKAEIIIPIGPGHEEFAYDAINSVHKAWKWSQGHFTSMHVIHVDDTKLQSGASAARNRGLDQSMADWIFFLDADDKMDMRAFTAVEYITDTVAYWGRIKLNDRRRLFDLYPCTTNDIFGVAGPNKTIAMGFWVQGALARSLRWNESLQLGEDFDFYCRIIKDNPTRWKKLYYPLCEIGYSLPSATGPNAHEEDADWQAACRVVIAQYEPRTVKIGRLK